MNKRLIVIVALLIAIAGFAAAAFLAGSPVKDNGNTAQTLGEMPSERLVRTHSPVIGPQDARVTIVEFFDPSCEACRAFYPEVKEIMSRYPRDVRLVLRYATLHPGSDEAVRMLEAARRQGVYTPVLEALLDQQPSWHDGNMANAWSAAAAAGLDVERARAELASPQITAMIEQDMADGQAVGVRGTPTFFVNGRQPAEFGLQQLEDLVRAEVEAGTPALER